MNIVIFEDEPAAVKRLIMMLEKIDPAIQVIASLESVEDAIAWFNTNKEPDLIFSDIQLSDGISFEIFESVEIKCPVVFVTAYDEYAVRAFEVNSIHYLLKPIQSKDLERSLEKFRKYSEKESEISKTVLKSLIQRLNAEQTEYKSRFLIKIKETFHSIPCLEVAYICIEDQLTKLITLDGRKHIIESSMDELDKMLDPKDFHRINRQMIVHANAVQVIHKWFNSRLKLDLNPPYSEEVIVSREKVKGFRQWLDR